jgi:AcrR family transcriptional regulator
MNTRTLRSMGKPVNPRPYDASGRRAKAQQTRRAILDAAARLFVEHGYATTTMAAIAAAAGVAQDTLYATIGPKPALFRLLVETAISGRDVAVPAEERDYVRAIRAASTASAKLVLYAGAMRRIEERLAPLLRVVQEAAPAQAEIGELWAQIASRRAGNMQLFVADLLATGELRPDISVEEAADVIWALNSSEFYLLLVKERGWTPERYEQWLADAWQRLLLRAG